MSSGVYICYNWTNCISYAIWGNKHARSLKMNLEKNHTFNFFWCAACCQFTTFAKDSRYKLRIFGWISVTKKLQMEVLAELLFWGV